MIRRYADDDSDQWLQAFATQERKTAVEVARDRTEPIQQQVRRALNPATPYTSVDEAVTAYRSMTGMDSLHQKRAAEQIRAVAVEEDAAEDPEKKKSPS